MPKFKKYDTQTIHKEMSRLDNLYIKRQILLTNENHIIFESDNLELNKIFYKIINTIWNTILRDYFCTALFDEIEQRIKRFTEEEQLCFYGALKIFVESLIIEYYTNLYFARSDDNSLDKLIFNSNLLNLIYDLDETKLLPNKNNNEIIESNNHKRIKIETYEIHISGLKKLLEWIESHLPNESIKFTANDLPLLNNLWEEVHSFIFKEKTKKADFINLMTGKSTKPLTVIDIRDLTIFLFELSFRNKLPKNYQSYIEKNNWFISKNGNYIKAEQLHSRLTEITNDRNISKNNDNIRDAINRIFGKPIMLEDFSK